MRLLKKPRHLKLVFEADGEYDGTWKFVNVTELTNAKSDVEMTIDHPRLIALVILYVKRPVATDQKVSVFTRGGKSSVGSTNYERMMVCMDVMAPSGNNIVTILLGRGQNPNFWSKHIAHRDTGIFSESMCAMVCIFI